MKRTMVNGVRINSIASNSGFLSIGTSTCCFASVTCVEGDFRDSTCCQMSIYKFSCDGIFERNVTLFFGRDGQCQCDSFV